MFKNRIRTAAIAGIAALATGISGTVAVAQPIGAEWTHADASAAYDAAPVHHTEESLKLATDETSAFITDEIEAAWRSLHAANNYDPSEEASAARFEAIRDLVEAEQANNDENIHDLQEAAAFALQQDKAAAEAWGDTAARAVEASNNLHRNLGTNDEHFALTANTQDVDGVILYIPLGGGEEERKAFSEFTEDEKYTIVELINAEGVITGAPRIDEALVPAPITNASTDAEKLAFIQALPALQAEVTDIYNQLGEFTFDEGAERYASRYYVDLITTLKGQLDNDVEEIEELHAAARDLNRVAQQSDVLIIHTLLERAIAQRDILRNINGLVLANQRYFELYNDRTITSTGKLLSTEYREVMENLDRGIFGAGGTRESLIAADEALEDAFRTWDGDRQYNADGTFSIVDERLGTSQGLYDNIIASGAEWREELNHVQALEDQVNAPSDNDKLLEAIQDLIDSRTDEEIEDNGDNGSVTPPTEGGSSFDAPEITGGSSDLGGFGIAAVIAAIIGVLALVVPNIQNFL